MCSLGEIKTWLGGGGEIMHPVNELVLRITVRAEHPWASAYLHLSGLFAFVSHSQWLSSESSSGT